MINRKDCILLTILLHGLLFVTRTNGQQNSKFELTISTHDIFVLVDETKIIDFQLSGILDQSINVSLTKQHDNMVQIVPQSFELLPTDDNDPVPRPPNQICILGVQPGNLDIITNVTPAGIYDTSNLFLRVTVAHSYAIMIISSVVGWIYFLAWSISFYPQIYYNYKRQSVVGLNFDFLALNIVGFVLYGLFNVGLFWIPEIENEYFERYPRGLNPVLVNDVVFALHASVATAFTIGQCFVYERGTQRVSITARSILIVFFILIIVFASLAGASTIHWLDFLYYCSYIKLTITLIKYVPQAVMNYRRKSTVGWSIGNILLDFTGGILSMLQMILNAYNFDDWDSIFGDPTKFGLGLFSVCFDIFFMVQHYILYRDAQPYSEIEGVDIPNDQSNNRNIPT